jgi:protease IV
VLYFHPGSFGRLKSTEGNGMRMSSSSSYPFVVLLLAPLLAGCGVPSFLVTPVSSSTKLTEEDVQPGKGRGKVAIVQVEGMLINARAGGFLQPTENAVSLFAQQMNHAARDKNVKAVVLRVNSPGGTVTASDLMYEIVADFREQSGKPVVASTQETAASGGYYISCAADRIVAHPTSVVGSIGVIFSTFEVAQMMEKVGVRNEAIKSGPLKDMGSPFKALRPDERQVMQAMVDDYYARFKSIVVAARPIDGEQRLTTATDGRIFSGTQAVAIGLADQAGLLEDAIELAKQSAGVPGAAVILYKRPYGYSGSIYASTSAPLPQQQQQQGVIVNLPDTRALMPTGFYYLWEP